MRTLLLIHAAVTSMMTGAIWFVQLVQYPLLAGLDGSRFSEVHTTHVRRIRLLVVPLMGVEAGAALALAFALPAARRPVAWLGLALLAGIWIATASIQVPLHRRLARGFDVRAARALVRTNWVRTVLWSARAALALGLLA